ncbi:MAG: hypothetical protein ACRDRZ_11485 [Pseudonocardiaceae bacterium]
MLETDAQRLAAAIEERVNTGAVGREVRATVQADRTRPDVVAPGAGRPTFIRYNIQIDDGTHVAVLDLGQATTLLDDIEPGWDSDRLFDAIRSREVPVEDTN